MLRILRHSHRIVYSESHKNQKNMTKKDHLHRMRLYVLISGKIAARSVNETARLVIDGGADAIQLREKTISDDEFISLAGEIRDITAKSGKIGRASCRERV